MSEELKKTSESNRNIDLFVDAKGLNCPLPLLKARKGLMQLQTGQYLQIVATDPASCEDIPVFCQETGHHLVERNEEYGVYSFIIQAK